MKLPKEQKKEAYMTGDEYQFVKYMLVSITIKQNFT